jgi:hypothetical protein
LKAAVQGAKLLFYLGHGNGYPNPYLSRIRERRQFRSRREVGLLRVRVPRTSGVQAVQVNLLICDWSIPPGRLRPTIAGHPTRAIARSRDARSDAARAYRTAPVVHPDIHGACAAATAAGSGGQPSATEPYRYSGSAGPRKRYCRYADRLTRIRLQALPSHGLFETTAHGGADRSSSSYQVRP